jgi:hypothetical protein
MIWKTLPPWPVVADPKPSVIDKLPAELRLEAYATLIPEDFKGSTDELRGILLSCKFLSQELNHELVRVYLANLNAAIAHVTATWDAAYDVPLRITQSGSTLHNVCLTVQIPWSILPEDPYMPGCPCYTPHEGVTKVSQIWNILLPLLAFRSRLLVFSICVDSQTEGERQRTYLVTEVLASLLYRGKLDVYEGSTYSFTTVEAGSVLAKRIELDWSAAGIADLGSSDNAAAIQDVMGEWDKEGGATQYEIDFEYTDSSFGTYRPWDSSADPVVPV